MTFTDGGCSRTFDTMSLAGRRRWASPFAMSNSTTISTNWPSYRPEVSSEGLGKDLLMLIYATGNETYPRKTSYLDFGFMTPAGDTPREPRGDLTGRDRIVACLIGWKTSWRCVLTGYRQNFELPPCRFGRLELKWLFWTSAPRTSPERNMNLDFCRRWSKLSWVVGEILTSRN